MPTQDIQTVHQHGRYELIGPVRIPLRLSNSNITDDFSIWYFEFQREKYAALTMGNLKKVSAPLCRIESVCIWGHLFDSQYCDCEWQLVEAKRKIAKEEAGIIVFAFDQHGKSVGLRNHFLVYAEGYRRGHELVVDAYKSLGFDEDYRTNYADVRDILQHFGVKRVRLLSNNPQRIKLLRKQGIAVQRVPLEMPLTQWNEEELMVKKRKLGHLLRLEGLSKPNVKK